jgi:hypothetical protein
VLEGWKEGLERSAVEAQRSAFNALDQRCVRVPGKVHNSKIIPVFTPFQMASSWALY